MARRRQETARPKAPVIASAAMISRSAIAGVSKTRPWQQQAWAYYDTVAALRSGVEWLANACSRARLYVGITDPNGEADPEPVEDERVQQLLEDFGGGPARQGLLMARMATHLSIVGEDYLIAYDDGEGERVWAAATTDELTSRGGQLMLRTDEGGKGVAIDPESSFVARVWRPHPRNAWEANSPVLPLMDELGILCGLSKAVQASIDSRLAGAGVWPIPESATLASATPEQDADGDEDPMMATLAKAMITPIRDRDSAAAVVPILMRMSDESLAALKDPISFASAIDPKTIEMTEAQLRSLAYGMDLPPEMLLGTSSANHWGAWEIEERSVKLHIKPMLDLMTLPFTERWLRPTLESSGLVPAGVPLDRVVIASDTSQLTLRPQRSEEAIELYKLGLVGPDTVRRESGFGDSDAPDPTELRDQLLFALAQTPQGAQMVAGQIGLPQNTSTSGGGEEGGGAGSGAGGISPPGSSPALPADHTRTRQLPTIPNNQDVNSRAEEGSSPVSAALTAAAEQAVLRTLEVAGKRMMNRSNRPRLQHLPPWEVHTRLQVPLGEVDRLMSGAWSTLAHTTTDPSVTAALDGYARSLLTGRQPHERSAMIRALEQR